MPSQDGSAGNIEEMPYQFRLYVTGSTPRSIRAIRNVLALLEEHIKDQYDLEIVDIYQDPRLARDGQVVAAPTLVREAPLPVRRLVGDMSDAARVSACIEINVV
jgi:circadian clock protein KaiB